MTLLIDMDGVICTEEKTFERALAKPKPGARESIQELVAAGHTIVIYTARTWAEFKVTEAWLKDHGIPYHGLQMGKPIADLHIDDRAVEFKNWPGLMERLKASPKYGPSSHTL